MALSTKLNHLPPLTPLPSADTMRSVQIEASAHHQVRGCPPATSPPCVALAALAGLSFSLPNLTPPPSSLPSLHAVFPPPPLPPPTAPLFCRLRLPPPPPPRPGSPLLPPF